MAVNTEEYMLLTDPLRDLGTKAELLIAELLEGLEFSPHAVRHRVKSEESARRKLDDPKSEGKYETMQDLHDMLGFRVIVYFSPQVDEVARLLTSEFDVQQRIDKRTSDSLKEFGYASLHLRAKISDRRSGLPEWARHTNSVFEIQIRTVLQHAWAEIEHDLGYKRDEVTDSVTRRFSAIAGALELLDDNFLQLKGELEREAKADEQSVKRKNLPLTGTSVRALVKQNKVVRDTDALIAATVDAQLSGRISMSRFTKIAQDLRAVGFRTTDEVTQILSAEGADLAKYFARLTKGLSRPTVSSGVSLSTLALHRRALMTIHDIRGTDVGKTLVSQLDPKLAALGAQHVKKSLNENGANQAGQAEIPLKDPPREPPTETE